MCFRGIEPSSTTDPHVDSTIGSKPIIAIRQRLGMLHEVYNASRRNESLLIREATDADDQALGELLVGAFARQFARKMPEVVMSPRRVADLRNQAEKREHATVLVAEQDGELLGTVSLYLWGAPRSEAWIEGAADLRLLAIRAEHQGRGLSSALLDAAEHYAQGCRTPGICLHTRRGVAGVSRLYQARGYVRDPTGDLDHLPEVFLEGFFLRFAV